ncbi:phage major capsid protein, HK97 family [Kaistia soli DSM 19436]|uniref:Phage major capsid protein, HK97 family n=1 Tax=Kaistia soli DSM 19436 TaxID=1122133 RepID=A0A1M5PQD6_9HYPH|nr:phage major capsid protein [Kaistia soli]SHH03968.1 phage major capsid protein, HK97 family [Kaistia soli DSM 19436]
MSACYPSAAFSPIELKAGDEADDIVTKALGDLQSTVEARLVDIEKKAGDRLDKIEAKLGRPALITKADDSDADVKAYDEWLRTGHISLETKALTTGAGSGAPLIPTIRREEIIEKLTTFSPVRQLAQVVSVNGGLLQIPRLVDEVVPVSVTEVAARTEDEPTFEQIDIKNFEMAVVVPVSRITLEDSVIDIGSFIGNHLAKKFGALESSWFISGNGTTQAEGVLTSTELSMLTTATTGTIVADEIIDLFYGLQSAYSASGSWLMNRATMALIRKMKGSDGQYIWEKSVAAGQPPSLLGRPVYEAPHMPNPTAGLVPIVFGDLASGYLITDRVAIDPIRDEVTGYGNGIVKFGARRRVGGKVVLGEALTKLRVKA